MPLEPFAVGLLVSVLGFFVVYVLVRSEASSTHVTDRASAERDERDFGGRDGQTDRD